jgi:hypothetical protein
MPPELVAFLRFRPALLSAFAPTADLTNSPSPRTWASVGRMLALDLAPAILAEAMAGAVGAGPAVEFDAFRRLYAEHPSVDAILVDPDAARIPTSPSIFYAVVTALAMRGNVQTFGRIARYAQRLKAEGHGEFGTLLVRDVVRRAPDVQDTPDFIRLMASDFGDDFTGASVNN